ncbi:hypothetical protein SAMN04488543_1430 [Friedmanniella luteola]|uniref:Uncharacterized protein n=1 Tax=Friedmanniella luteola TaxID=546871 RepID=A0A1H1QXV2_9ACTN|nr:hypothetical protein [Friedmanniella luteola]SDS28125.1 hypothetical protein SAMN04488543_1430 [Friedmanniella luteola]
MLWVVLFLVLALGALAVLVGYAVWLAHKTADVLSEVGQLADRAAQLADLVGQVGVPAAAPGESPTGPVTGRAGRGR